MNGDGTMPMTTISNPRGRFPRQRALVAAVLAVLAAGCTVVPERLTPEQIAERVKRDHTEMYADQEVLTFAQRRVEDIMLGIRMRDGLPAGDFAPDVVATLHDEGLIEVGERIRLTRSGRLLANRVIEGQRFLRKNINGGAETASRHQRRQRVKVHHMRPADEDKDGILLNPGQVGMIEQRFVLR